MSVKFTPGPHPTSRSSSSVFLPSSHHLPPTQTGINEPDLQTHSTDSTAPNSPIRFTTSHSHRHASSPSEAERQPLLPPRQLNRSTTFYTVLGTVLVMLLVGVVVFGGWQLGKGEGGGRWPGGPH
ncbi:hypothetical protein CI109_104690 [Kwoniella shandongensis]|uniref:Uncharacterized protein n=1 Tax=Kwoniella shandongensis TaxID=1734106 RepID=A0A5M6BVY8_9TREE|nr:uncharacterized protein CI109_004853 [Kwoniella shandongensis]KAA5526853.1 hypothetical protein CI109_004853 [Kwoniella shandongensis]